MRGTSLATGLFAELGLSGEFLGVRHTRQWFRAEQHLPSAVIDRASVRAWAEAGEPDTGARARARVAELLAQYQPRPLAPEVEKELRGLVERSAQKAGMSALP
jgi:trimethylamine:corrinoid methyltransferase-like protein